MGPPHIYLRQTFFITIFVFKCIFSNRIESEDQLEDARNPNDKEKDQENERDCKEEKGIDMSEDFDAKMQDLDKNPDNSSDDNQSEASDLDKEMGETEQGAEK